ncbi:hypothetical protein [Variovorax ginsengisoli]|uniref:Lipoprotein n=1 Tax=Variovorax ginsengisoli TaxID=363844 RepID=A0ABT8SDS6_9BURK|nr:hypothetical protein [Variovorax ginsengisoli]MDN8617324.1 hypothetical protein [Variovorax ginsengisoli]MDO1536494.1 hypothetical protein [Variovorax ginsengisoli]
MKSKILLSLSLVSLAALHGCGGGGGGGAQGFPLMAGDSGSPPKSEPAQAPDEQAPSGTPTPEPTPTPTPDRPPAPTTDPFAPVAGSEAAPSLSAPQPGSTADVGSASEGIYESLYGITFVGPTGQLVRRDLLNWVWGSIAVNGSNWSFNSDTRAIRSTSADQTVTGSGTFTPKKAMNGTYSLDGRPATDWGPLTYSLANALAVTQESLAGKWATANSSTFNMSIEVDATGSFTGTTSGSTIGVCSISGSAVQTQPGTAKNSYAMTLSAINAASSSQTACALDTTLPYTGPAGIVLTSAGIFVGNGYFRTLTFHAKSPNGALITSYLQKAR